MAEVFVDCYFLVTSTMKVLVEFGGVGDEVGGVCTGLSECFDESGDCSACNAGDVCRLWRYVQVEVHGF